MVSEEAILIPEYVSINIQTLTEDETFTFSNHEIRGDVDYFDGRSTQVFKTPTGEGTSMPETKPRYFKFRVRFYEDYPTRAKVEKIRSMTQGRYTASFTLNHFHGSFSAFPTSHTVATNNVQTLQAGFPSCVFEIPDDPIDNSARGLGVIKDELEIKVYPFEGVIALPEAPPIIRLGIGDYTDLPNFGDSFPGTIAAGCIVTIDGALQNTRGDLLAPQVGAILRLFFFDCVDSAGTGSAPASTDGVEFDYSADVNLSTATPSGGDAGAITYFTTKIRPYLTGGTGLFAKDATANSGELTLTLNVPSFRSGGAGSITLCLRGELQLSTGQPSTIAQSVFESDVATAAITVDDTDLEAIVVSMSATACGGNVDADPNTTYGVQINLSDPLGLANGGVDIPFCDVRFPGGTGTNGPLQFLYSMQINASDRADFESAFTPLPAGTTRGFTYNKKLFHTKGTGYDFITNGDYTTKTTTTGNDYWAAAGGKKVVYADGSTLQEGFEHLLNAYVIIGGRMSNNFPTHRVCKGFMRMKGFAFRLSALGNSTTFPNDEIRIGFTQYSTTPSNSYPPGVNPIFGIATGGTEWYNLDTGASSYELDGASQTYNGSASRTHAGQSAGWHVVEADMYMIGGLRSHSKIPVLVPGAPDPLDSLYRNPGYMAHITEVIPNQNNVRIDFRIEQQASASPAITAHSWAITETLTGASIDSGSGASLTGRTSFVRNISGSDIRARQLKVRIEFTHQAATFFTESDVRIEETF